MHKSSTNFRSVSPITSSSSSSSPGLTTPGSPGSSTSEDSADDFASKSDQQHPHHSSPRLNSKDWNHTTVKNVSNETVRKDLLFKGTNQALQQEKMSPFHTESRNYRTINPSVGWFGICSPPVRTDILHCVCALHAPLTSRSPSWQSPSVTIPVTGAVSMGEPMGELRALLAPLDQAWGALDFNEGCSCSCKVLIWIQISQSGAQMI